MSQNVSDLLVNMLVNAGVKRVYAVTGDSLNPINDAIRRDGRLQWVQVRHEEVGAYAASMEAELNGIGCCMGSSGPGHVHLVNGLYDANRSGNPVIAIASTAATNKLGTDYFQETNVTKLFDDCSKYCFMANTPEQAIHGMQGAIQHAISEKGVGVLGLPGDVAAAKVKAVPSSERNYFAKPMVTPGIAEIEELSQVLNTNKKVMLYCGYGAKDAQEEVLELCKKLNAPLGYSFRGKIFYDKEENPYVVGLNGLLGTKSGYTAMHEADVVFLLGTDFPYSDFLPDNNVIIQIDEKPERIGRRAKVDYGYAGDIKSTLEVLLPLIEQKTDDSFLQEMRKIHEDIEEKYESYITAKAKDEAINPEYVASIIDRVASDDAIFTVDTGMSAVWAARYLHGKKNRYLTGSFNHGSMANAMPMAIGAGMAYPNRQVVALCGDGGLNMLMGDLMTISQYDIPVKLIVFNNRSLGMVKLEMEVAGLPDWQTDNVNPDYALIAKAMNIKSWAARKPADVAQTIEEAFAYNGPALVEVFTDPNALAMPPKVTFDQVRGFTMTMAKMLWDGRGSEVIETAKSNMKYMKELF